MCYKQEKRLKEDIRLNEKIEHYPRFIKSFFSKLKGTNSRLNYFSVINDFLNYLLKENLIEKNKINDITNDDLKLLKSSDVIAYFDKILLNGNSQQTVEQKCKKLKSFFNYLVKEDYIHKNIIDKDLDKKYKSENINNKNNIKVPSDEDVKSFLTSVENECRNEETSVLYETIIRLFLGTGIRAEELIGLDVDDLYFDFKNDKGESIDYRYITVLGKGNIDPKNGKSIVKIDEDAVEWIYKWLEIRNQIEINDKDKNALFISNQGNRISKSNINFFFVKYSNNITPHQLRHWYGTKLYEYTKDIVEVQNQLRHKSLEVTVKYYVKIDESNSYNNMNKMKKRFLRINKIK